MNGATATTATDAPGRVCPVDYTYAPDVFARRPDLQAETLYVIGGLYGNLAALDAVEQLAEWEPGPVTLVFNGDYHWFDAETAWFDTVDSRISRYHALRGNVETEIAREQDAGAGCGCAYPASVPQETVERSNAILQALRAVAPPARFPHLRRLPMHLVVMVGGLRIGIVHGDARSLAGWGFARERLADPDGSASLRLLQRESLVDVFACTHTCLAALRDRPGPERLTVINNGAAGMPNFCNSRFGVISRISVRPSPHARLYGLVRDGVYLDAVAVPFDTAAFLDRFLVRWPPGSAAYESYFQRIMQGTDHAVSNAVV